MVIQEQTTPIKSYDEALNYLNSFDANTPSDTQINILPNTDLKKLLLALKKIKINEIRNDVAHKVAYRPKKSTVIGQLSGCQEILYKMRRTLKKQGLFYENFIKFVAN